MPRRHRSPLRRWVEQTSGDPFVLARLAISSILVFATVVALALWISGVAPRAWLAIGAIWAVYGMAHGAFDLVLEPLADFLARAVTSVGLERAGGGFSEIETLEAQGHLEAAAAAYLLRAESPGDRVSARVRRAALLAGPMAQPDAAVAELEALRRATPGLRPAEEIMIGLALADLYEHRLGADARAMAELRRLIDRYPRSLHARTMRTTLAALRNRHFGDLTTPEPGA